MMKISGDLHSGRWMAAAGVALAGLCVSGVAQAQSGAGVAQKVHEIQLKVHGSIAQQCELGHIAAMSFGDLARSNLGMSDKVALYCNVPFSVTIKAANGGLAHERLPLGQGPYAGTLPYTLGVSIPVSNHLGAQANVSGNFAGRDLRSGQVLYSGSDYISVSNDGMVLDVSLGAPRSEAGLLAGNYSETIEITVAPS